MMNCLQDMGTKQGQRNLGNLIILLLIPLYESLTPHSQTLTILSLLW